MTKHIRPIIGCTVLTILAFTVGRSLAQRPQVQDEPEVNPLDDKIWVARVKLELANRKPDLKKLALERRDAARKAMDARLKRYVAGGMPADYLIEFSKRLLDAELALDTTKAARLAALERHWLLAKKVEEINKGKFDVGRVGADEYYPFVQMRLEAELQLVRAQMDLEKPMR